MKAIVISYVIMLLLCVFVGFVFALTLKCALLYGFLVFFPLGWSYVPLRELRKGAYFHHDFTTILFVISFAVLVIVVFTVTTLLMNMETFLSVMCIASSWVALLMTALFLLLMPREKNLQKGWVDKWIIKKVGIYLSADLFLYRNILFCLCVCFFLS